MKYRCMATVSVTRRHSDRLAPHHPQAARPIRRPTRWQTRHRSAPISASVSPEAAEQHGPHRGHVVHRCQRDGGHAPPTLPGLRRATRGLLCPSRAQALRASLFVQASDQRVSFPYEDRIKKTTGLQALERQTLGSPYLQTVLFSVRSEGGPALGCPKMTSRDQFWCPGLGPGHHPPQGSVSKVEMIPLHCPSKGISVDGDVLIQLMA